MQQKETQKIDGCLPSVADRDEAGARSTPAKRPSILVVTRTGHMSEPVMEYALSVADRLRCHIIAVHINTQPFCRDGGRRSCLFASAMAESTLLFREKAGRRGVMVQHFGDAGKVGSVVRRICLFEKRIEFVVLDHGISKAEVVSRSPVPVFSVIRTGKKAGLHQETIYHNSAGKGAKRMSNTSKKRHIRNCFTFGMLTAVVYAAVFTNQELVMSYFTKGGIFSLLPVGVVFFISYAHGNFTSSFWSALGIEGSRSTKQAETRRNADIPAVKKDARPRAEARL